MANESLYFKRPCVGTTHAGRACQAAAMFDASYCFFHNPESAEEAAKARRIGGVRRRKESIVRLSFEYQGLTTAEQIRRLIDIVAIDALALDGGVGRLRILILCIDKAIRLLQADLEDRISALEALERRRSGG